MRVLATGLALAMLLAASATAQASTVVLTDSGGSSSDVAGTTTGATVDSNTYADTITTINSTSVSLPLSFHYTVDTTQEPGGFALVTGGSGTKTISDGVNSVTLAFSLSTGTALGSHFNMDGTITGIVGTTGTGMPVYLGVAYDFSKMVGGAISLANDKTLTNYDLIVNHTNTYAETQGIGSGFGVQEAVQSVPEPASIALLGIGISGFFAFRRFFKRTSVG